MVLTVGEKLTMKYILENVKDVMESNGTEEYMDNGSFILSLDRCQMEELISVLNKLDNE